MSEVLGYQEFQEAMDSVNPKAVKKKFKDRKDKDIDNDGDVDASDKYLHKRRKAVSKAVKKEDMDKPMTSADRAKAMQKKADKVKKDAEAKLKKAKGLTMGEGKYAKYSDLLLKKQRMKKMGQNTMVVDKEIEAEKKKVQSAGPMKMKKEETEIFEDAKDVLKRMRQTRDNLKKQGNSAGLAAMNLRIKKFRDSMSEESIDEKGKGLYYNINKKRKEGRPMRKKGEKGAPSETDFANAKKTAQEERENCHSKDHDCATVVEHIVWGFGKPVYESHAVPTDDGYVSWYDVEFEHGIEKEVPTEDLKIYTTEAHEKKEKDKKKMLPAKKGKHSDDDEEMDEEKYSDSEIQRAVEIAKKMAGSNYTGASNAIEKMKKGLSSVGKVKYALRKAAESFETFNGLTISEVQEIVKDLTDSAQDYIKLVEDGDVKSVDEPEVEPVKGMPLSFKQFKSKIGD